MSSAKNCSKCGGSMVEGFVLDRGDYGSVNVPKWQPGEPRKSFWTGIKEDSDQQLEVSTYRCQRCGYLESYAAKA
jgi:ribosomal protein S27AE